MNLEITDRWLSVQEIAHYLGISKETIYRWLDSKKIPAHKIGKQWKFKTVEVDQWIRCGEASDEATVGREKQGGLN
ncbi:MAG: helix-turn-helix domain-containing protein [Bacteriovorax sp.]